MRLFVEPLCAVALNSFLGFADMLSPRSILAPFTPRTAQPTALLHALSLASRLQVPLHVTPWPGSEATASAQDVRIAVRSYVSDGPPPPHIHVAAWEERPFSVDEWLQYTQRHAVDLITLSRFDAKAPAPPMACTDLQPMIMRTKAALLMVQVPSDTAGFAQVVVPTDITPEAVPTLHHAEALAAVYNTQLTLLHVLQRRQYVALTPTDLLSVDSATMAPRTAHRRLRTWYRRHAHPKHPLQESPRMKIEQGDPATTIVQETQDQSASLIVMAATQGTPREAGLSPITENVLRRTTCPVFVTRPHHRSLVRPARISSGRSQSASSS